MIQSLFFSCSGILGHLLPSSVAPATWAVLLVHPLHPIPVWDWHLLISRSFHGLFTYSMEVSAETLPLHRDHSWQCNLTHLHLSLFLSRALFFLIMP